MMKTTEVKANKRTAGGHHVLTLRASRIFAESQPGQFVMVKIAGHESPLLPRPISIYDVRNENGEVFLDLLIRVVGRGTSMLVRLRPGDHVELLGPLGKGYNPLPEKNNTVLIAGGIGIAPLVFLADRISQSRKGNRGDLACYVGARSGDFLCGMERLKQSCSAVYISTEDGSFGCQGVVTDLFEKDLKRFSVSETSFYACGPLPMLKKLQAVMKRVPFRCQVSVEERMACGVGACLGCAVGMKNGTYGRACKDGPVFDLSELEFQ